MSERTQPTEVAHDQRQHYVYCVNFHGSCLNSIKNEFKHQIQSGLRQSVFILDLNDVLNELNHQPDNSKRQHEFHSASLMNAVLQRIQDFRKEYDLIKRQIRDEFKFDIYSYWLEDEGDKLKINLADTARIKGISATSTTNKVRRNELKKDKFAKNSTEILSTFADENMKNDECLIQIVLREHNRALKLKCSSKTQYIKDDPNVGKLYIIIMGRMSENFYIDLLRQNQPLQGIVHYVPTECKYDILLGNNEIKTFIMETMNKINSSICEQRQEDIAKPIGLFINDLPVISSCIAKKYGREIFDQVIWNIYDIDVLKQQYESYYYIPYQEIDVGIPLNVDLKELFHVAESLSVQGHFQKNYIPGSVSDVATIFAYLNSLLNTCALPDNVLRESNTADNHIMPDLSKTFSNAFSSIIKIPKWDRLIVAENNKLLYSMLQYTDQHMFRNIYLSCLEYDLARQYALIPYQGNKVFSYPLGGANLELLPLPKYVKYYANADCCLQRISELLEEYEDCHVDEINPGCKLYTFKRTHNAIFTNERILVIPTRLCFRDFTLFQRDEFLKNLKTPDMCKAQSKEENNIVIDENVFVMPNSLKALKTQTEMISERSTGRSDLPNEPYIGASKFSEEWVGLPLDSHILKGYNLGGVRQEVKIKNTKYYYDNGFVKLYEETFCFQDMNKELILGMNNSTLFFNREPFRNEGLCNNIRLITKNNISLRILNDPKECSKIVMNYPNGLTIYQHDMDCEQIWYSKQSCENEQRRIFTPYGAIIVEFKTEDMILIMRYNGEVYRLYQHDLTGNEKEEKLSENLEKSSGIVDGQAQCDYLKNKEGYVNRMNKNGKEKYEIGFKLDLNQGGSKKFSIAAFENIQMPSSPTSITEHLKTSISDELRFLNHISSVYHLSYLHLNITTSQGKRIIITSKGKYTKYHYPNYLMTAEGTEEYTSADARYISYTCGSWLMQHPHYADVYIKRVKLYASNPLVFMEILGIDNIRINTHTEELTKDKEYHVSHDKSGVKEDEQVMNAIINVWIGENLKLTTEVNGFSINAVMEHFVENSNNFERDSLTLRLKYTDNISDAFQYLVNEIATYRHCNVQKTEEIHFMENVIDRCTKRGFELLKNLPLLSEFSNEISNCIIEVKPLKTMCEFVNNVFEWNKADMNKFPRFKKYQPKKSSSFEQDFPKVLSANVYIKIPHQLQNTADISKFLEPFGTIHFKNLRRKFKDLLDFHLKPQLQLDLKRLYSSKNWETRKLEHKRRIFGEQKRFGLYYAMIKYKIYPNYWKFIQNYYGHVSYIDFFDFMQYKCANKRI